jgi:hypothetical protein
VNDNGDIVGSIHASKIITMLFGQTGACDDKA